MELVAVLVVGQQLQLVQHHQFLTQVLLLLVLALLDTVLVVALLLLVLQEFPQAVVQA